MPFSKQHLFFTMILLFLVDSVFLFTFKNFFGEQIKRVQGSKLELRVIPAILCYLSLGFGLYYFIIREKKQLIDAFLLGILVYSVYEMTNLSTLKNWSPLTSLIDTLWGGTLFTIITAIMYRVI